MKDESVKIKFTDRWHFIDLMKTIGLLFVVMYHYDTYSYDIQENAGLLIYCRYCLRAILSTGVPLFFFASGYLFFHRDFQLEKHVRKTIKMVAQAVAWGILGLLIIMPIEGQYFSAGEFLHNLVRLAPMGWINHLWFMEVLVFIYIFAPFLRKMFDKDKRYLVLLTVISGAVTVMNCVISNGAGIIPDTVLKDRFVSIENTLYTTIRGFSVVFFCAGGLAKGFENKIKRLKHINRISAGVIIVSCLLLSAAGIFLTVIQGVQWDVVYNGYDTLFTFMNVICIYILTLNYRGNIGIIKTISCNTLGIYYIHNILIRLTGKYASGIPLFCNFFGSMIYAAGLILTGLLIVTLMKKIPLMKKLVS